MIFIAFLVLLLIIKLRFPKGKSIHHVIQCIIGLLFLFQCIIALLFLIQCIIALLFLFQCIIAFFFNVLPQLCLAATEQPGHRHVWQAAQDPERGLGLE